MHLTNLPPLDVATESSLAGMSAANMTLIGCVWIATFQLCIPLTLSRHVPLTQYSKIDSEMVEEVVAMVEDSGEKLTLITMADSNRETSAVNLTTFSEILHAKDNSTKLAQIGRKIAKSTLTAYLRKKIDQLYTLEMMLQSRKKSRYLIEGNLLQVARPYFNSHHYKGRWKLTLSYTILINFGFDGKAHILFSNTHWDDSGLEQLNKECNIDEIYDPINRKCRLVTCGKGYEFIDGKCRSVTGGDSNVHNISPTSEKTPIADIEDGMTLIVLQANVTLSSYITTLTPEFKPMMIESLSGLLNITEDRIKNFTINVMNNKTEPQKIAFHKIPERYFGMNIEYLNTNDQLPESTSVPEIATSNKTEAENETTQETETKDENSFPNIPLEISFMLVPLNETTNGKSVSTIVQEMDSLVQNKEFTFNVNETSLTVVGLKNEQEPTMVDTWCEHGIKRYYSNEQFSIIDIVNEHKGGQKSEMIYVNETDTSYETGEFDLTIFVRSTIGQDKANVSAFVFVCDAPKLKDKSCGRISLDSSEYKSLPNLSVVFGQHLLGLGEYQRLDNDKIVICIPSTMKTLGFFTNDCGNTNQNLILAQIAFTLIFGVLSLVAMFAVLVTYTLFPKLRNIPGINTMNLTIALFCAELIFLLFGSVDSKFFCTTVAIFLHYFFLASFFWMNVMSYDLYCTFGHTNILPWPRSKRKVIPRYLLYAWGAPALIVGLCVAIDFSHIFPSVRVGYGMSDTVDVLFNGRNETRTELNATHSFLQDSGPRRLGCWIQDPLASLIAFGVPLICIVLVNAVLFTRTIFSIRKTIRTINLRISNPASGKDDVVLYVRMSVVMGFTWVLGIASSFISSGANPSYSICLLLNIVGLFFVIFNCSQGIFICFVFVLNQRVAGYYKELWKRVTKKLRRKKITVAHISVERGPMEKIRVGK